MHVDNKWRTETNCGSHKGCLLCVESEALNDVKVLTEQSNNHVVRECGTPNKYETLRDTTLYYTNIR